MAKKMLIDATHPEETRVVVADGNRVEEFDFETASRLRLAGNIYLAKVTRVEPSLQAAFIEYGGNRHGFLAFSEIHPDYYQIPIADRQALLAEEEAFDQMHAAESEAAGSGTKRSGKGRSRTKTAAARSKDAVVSGEASAGDIPGMGVVDLDTGSGNAGDAASTEAQDGEAEASVEKHAETDAGPATADSPETDTESPEIRADGRGNSSQLEQAARIESITGDEAEEIRQPRRSRPRPYKIQEVIKVRQIMLVQVIKEERGTKGAALTTYISLAGRYCVLMPNTARGGGISRRITDAPDRSKLKEIASELSVPKGAGLIIRTAGAKRTKSEIKRDYEFLQRLWEEIRELTLNSIAPVQIYEEGNLIKRSIRDLYGREIDEVLVEGAEGYKTAKDFMKMIMPSHARKVHSYEDPMPLFSRYKIESHLSSMYAPTVQLKSGGYIVIGVTEALVAIDVNSGRATREGSVEETALKTNLEAAEEIARQLRLRDLAGLIVIDFIDMDERRNNAAVEKRFKNRLRSDRSRIQVGNISGFGLLEMSRQRQRMGMIEATTQACAVCHGTGRVRSDENVALSALRQLEEEGTRRRYRELLLKAPVGLVNFLINQKREHVAEIETRYGVSIRVEADASMVSPDYAIEKFRTATRSFRKSGSVISVDASMMPDLEEESDDDEVAEDSGRSEEPRSKSRRRGRRRRSGSGGRAKSAEDSMAVSGVQPDVGADTTDTIGDVAQGESLPEGEEGGKRSGGRRRSGSRDSGATVKTSTDAQGVAMDSDDVSESSAPSSEKKPKRATRKRGDRSTSKIDGEIQNAGTDAEGSTVTMPSVTPEPVPLAASTVSGSTGGPDSGVNVSEPPLNSGLSSDDSSDGENRRKRRGWWWTQE